MPTDYTHCIGEGATFEEFILKCAESFGGGYMHEDVEMLYLYKNNIIENKIKKDKVLRFSDKQKKELSEKEFIKKCNYRSECVEGRIDLHEKYIKMSKCIDEWFDGDKDFLSIVTFMRNQIKQSIEFDCDDIKDFPICLHPEDPDIAWKNKIKELNDNIRYYQNHYNELKINIKKRKKWMKKLHKRLERFNDERRSCDV